MLYIQLIIASLMFISVKEVKMITQFITIQSVEIDMLNGISPRLNTGNLRLVTYLEVLFGAAG